MSSTASVASAVVVGMGLAAGIAAAGYAAGMLAKHDDRRSSHESPRKSRQSSPERKDRIDSMGSKAHRISLGADPIYQR
jgi:hypothetical protein